MNIEKLSGIIRHILTFAGGWAVGKGYLEAEAVEAIIGGVVAVIGAVWSWKAKKSIAE
jgi:hypothetical protein